MATMPPNRKAGIQREWNSMPAEIITICPTAWYTVPAPAGLTSANPEIKPGPIHLSNHGNTNVKMQRTNSKENILFFSACFMITGVPSTKSIKGNKNASLVCTTSNMNNEIRMTTIRERVPCEMWVIAIATKWVRTTIPVIIATPPQPRET